MLRVNIVNAVVVVFFALNADGNPMVRALQVQC